MKFFISSISILLFGSGVFAEGDHMRFRAALGTGVAHPNYIGGGNKVGAIFSDGIGVTVQLETEGSTTEKSETDFFLSYANGQYGVVAGQVESDNGSVKETDTYLAAAATAAEWGFGIGKDDISLLYGVGQSFRVGVNYNSATSGSEVTSIGAAMDYSTMSVALDYSSYESVLSGASTILGLGLGFYFDAFLLGVNLEKHTLESLSDFDRTQAFLGFAGEAWHLIVYFRPETNATLDDKATLIQGGFFF
ncbi:MAG: hypothetical protein AB8E15_02660 [Bdellovibrionales bacterium]